MLKYNLTRRSDREAEGARLLSEYGPQAHLGFESLLLRHLTSVIPILHTFLFSSVTEVRVENKTCELLALQKPEILTLSHSAWELRAL